MSEVVHQPTMNLSKEDRTVSEGSINERLADEFNEKASVRSYNSDEPVDELDEACISPIKTFSTPPIVRSNPQGGSIGTNSTKSMTSPPQSVVSEIDAAAIRRAEITLEEAGVDIHSEPALSTAGESFASNSSFANHPYEKDGRKLFVGGLASSGKSI